MPQERQRMLGEIAVMALGVELGEPTTQPSKQGRHIVWRAKRGDRPSLTVRLMLEPNGGSYPVRLLIGDPGRTDGEAIENILISAAADINGIVGDIHRRMGRA